MIQAWLLAIGQLSDPRMRKPLLIGLAAAFVLFLLLFGGGTWLVASAASDGGWLERVLEALGGIAAFAVAVLLFGPATLIVAGMLLDDVADAVEARHYPALTPPRRPGLAEQALMGLGLGLRVLGLTLLALPVALFLPGIGWVVWLLVSSYALAREYSELAALRRMDRPAVRAWRRRHRLSLIVAGLPAAALSMVPIANLLVPVLGAAAFTHIAIRLGAAGPAARP
ncbi:EI24 domain-containing protein [Elioraea rosea]|uniref:EI24 domain-containing protein n=1 Tax=Elioraea rosea TaxID=2492390 RepID=UPI00131510D5|nr:EI24 domain-containing protein [Elioraea rosea]